MKKGTRTFILKLLLCIVVAFLISMAFASYSQKKLEKAFDESDKNIAIEYLSERKGMILEVEFLSYRNIPNNVLLDELEVITSSSNYTNKYLDDFAFDIPNTSDVGEICEKLILQIDDQIYTIKYGAKGE